MICSRRVLLLSLTSLLILFSSCYGSWNFLYKGNNVDERTSELRILTDSSSQKFEAGHISDLEGQYTVLVLSDTHFGNKKNPVPVEKLYAWLDSVQGTDLAPKFGLCLGDMVDTGSQDQYNLYNDFVKKLEDDYGLHVIFNCCGNHDIYQNNWDNWEANCYPNTSFYKFHTKNFSWYCLDTASGTFGLNQYRKIIQDFEFDKRRKVIFTHYPFFRFNMDCANLGETTERNKLLSDFAKNNVACLLGGHIHRATYDNLGFNDYSIPSFAYTGSWGLLYVDEDAGTARLDFIP